MRHGLKDPETAERTAGGAFAIHESAPTTAGVMRLWAGRSRLRRGR